MFLRSVQIRHFRIFFRSVSSVKHMDRKGLITDISEHEAAVNAPKRKLDGDDAGEAEKRVVDESPGS